MYSFQSARLFYPWALIRTHFSSNYTLDFIFCFTDVKLVPSCAQSGRLPHCVWRRTYTLGTSGWKGFQQNITTTKIWYKLNIKVQQFFKNMNIWWISGILAIRVKFHVRGDGWTSWTSPIYTTIGKSDNFVGSIVCQVNIDLCQITLLLWTRKGAICVMVI